MISDTIIMEKLLNKVYNDPSSPSYLAGVQAVYREARKALPSIKLKDVEEFLQRQDVYTLHKPIRKKFPRNRVVTAGLDCDWQIDLVDLKALAKYNKGYKYLFMCIDVLSKFLWAVPVKKKTPDASIDAFTQILKSGRKPWRVCSDKGTEFGKKFRDFLAKNDVHHFFATSPDVKASVIERANRTLKTRLWRHFTKRRTFSYLDILPKLIDDLNHSVNRMTKHAPVDVTPANETRVRAILYKQKEPSPIKFKYQVGDAVRITKEKSVLHKGYLPNFTLEKFRVKQKLHRTPVAYRLEDEDGESITGIFYESELSKVGRMRKVYKRRQNK